MPTCAAGVLSDHTKCSSSEVVPVSPRADGRATLGDSLATTLRAASSRSFAATVAALTEPNSDDGCGAIAAGCGAGIYAAHAGTVEYAGYNGGYGNYIRINHGGGVGTGYGHIRPGGIFVRPGQWVNAGQLIASEGNTGNSFGCHLHFETYVNGYPVNPINFMRDRGVSV